MLTLCINTAGHLNSLAIVKNGELIAEENWKSERNETETILPKLEELLENVKLKINDIEAINIIQGIGGFTSLRVGISIANTIAYVQNIPIYATSIFELWLKRVNEKDIAILIDAGRQEYFYFSTKNKNYYSPQIIPNIQLSKVKENFWIGEINDKQKLLFPKKIQEFQKVETPGKAFTQIDLTNKKPYQTLEPWYGREPNISRSKKKLF